MIHVRVVDSRGQGVPGAAVEPVGYDFNPPRSFQTDAQGHVQIPRRTAGDQVSLLARGKDQSLACTIVGFSTVKEAPGTKASPAIMTLLALTHRVTGLVLDCAGKAIPGVEIAIESLSYPTNRSAHLGTPSLATHFPRTLTDQAEQFALILPEKTDVSFSARHARFMGHRTAKADAPTLEPMTLEPAGTISGTVTDVATSRPFAGVGAQLIEHRKRILGGWGNAMTDDRGRFAIIGLEPGVYNLLFESARGRLYATAHAIEGLRVRAGH